MAMAGGAKVPEVPKTVTWSKAGQSENPHIRLHDCQDIILCFLKRSICP
jgi:hypothetical protein